MAIYTRYVGIKFKQKEYEIIEQKAKDKKCKSVSAFIRDSLLENNGMLSQPMKQQMYDLQWEIKKIGTNINQATKRINSGIASHMDVKEMLANQQKLNLLLQEYIDGVNDRWQ